MNRRTKRAYTVGFDSISPYDVRRIRRLEGRTALREQARGLEVSEKQIEILARRLLPEIRRFFANENIRKEYEEWLRKRADEKTK